MVPHIVNSIGSAPNCEIRPYISKLEPNSDLILRENQTKIGPKIRLNRPSLQKVSHLDSLALAKRSCQG